MVRMAAIYGHYTLDDLREAVEGNSKVVSPLDSPVKSPVDEAENDDVKPN
jgi:hypothetical protein